MLKIIKICFLIPQNFLQIHSVCTVFFLLLTRHFNNPLCLRYRKNKIYAYIFHPLLLKTHVKGCRQRAHQQISPSWEQAAHFLVPTRQHSPHAALHSDLCVSCLSYQTGVILGQETYLTYLMCLIRKKSL